MPEDPLVADIVSELRRHAPVLVGGWRDEVRVRIMRSGSSVADGASIYLVADRFVMNLAPPAFPDIAREDARAMNLARRHLGSLGEVILPVVASGAIAGRSYYITPLARPASERRILRAFQKRRIRGPVLEWLRGLASLAEPNSDSTNDDFVACLTSLAEFSDVSAKFRDFCQLGIEQIRAGEFLPRHCPMHGDMWLGNVLRSKDGALVIIDWRGSRMHGYPLFDLLRYAVDLNLDPVAAGTEIRSHCALLGLDPIYARTVMLAGFGHYTRELGEFPARRLREKAAECEALLTRALAN